MDNLFTIKPEAVSGTLETLAGSDVVRCYDFLPTIQEFSAVERETLGVRPGTPQPSAMTMRMMRFAVPMEWAGSGTPGTASGNDKIALAAGMGKAVVGATSITRTPAWPAPATTYSVGFYCEGVRYAGAGARCNKLTIEAEANGPLRATAEFMALYRDSVTAANPASVTYPPQVDANIFDGAATTPGSATLGPVGGTAVPLCFTSFSWVKENTMELIDDFGCFPYINFTKYAINGSCRVARPAISTLDIPALRKNSTLCALTLPIGTTAGNIMTFNQPRIQLTSVELVDVKGLPYYDIEWVARFGDLANQEGSIVET